MRKQGDCLDRLKEEFHRLMRETKKINRMVALKPGERLVMEVLVKKAEGKELTPSQISSEIGLPLPNLSPVLRNLEQMGYLYRRHGSEDRRNIYLCATQDGAAAFEQSDQKIREIHQGLLEQMSAEDANKLLQLLKQMADYFENLDL